MFKNKKGFTLIELLVVIAIIGVLASVVLASLNTARDKGNDAAIKANLANVRAQAELYFTDNSNSYGTESVNSCATALSLFVDPVITNAIAAANSASSGSASCYSSDAGSGTTATSWAISIPLSGTSNTWCVDSTGAAEATTAGGTATAAALCS